MIRYGMVALTALLAACGTSEQPAAPQADTGEQAKAAKPVVAASAAPPPLPTPGAGPSATPVTATALRGVTSCNAEIGKPAAAKLAQQCTSVSPATRPPCNGANSCAMIRAEIARSCSVIDDGTPVAGCASAPDGTAAAAEIIRIYYSAIAARDYSVAYAMWDGDGTRSGKSPDAFASGFADTDDASAKVGTPGAIEGAAGSSYVTIPVSVRARTAGGATQRFIGSYVLRRANQPRSQGWRIYSAKLREAQSAAAGPRAHRIAIRHDDGKGLSIPTTLDAHWAPAFTTPVRNDAGMPAPR